MEGGKKEKWGIYVILSAIKKKSLKKPEDAHLEWALHSKMFRMSSLWKGI